TADPEHVLEELGAQLPQEHEYDTISGLIVDLLGRIPTEDETPTVTYGNIDFTVLVIEDRRIEKIKAVIKSEVESKNDDEESSKNKGEED
ncbi:MAG TPA: transporter associated domain-containing protein, partial [Oscillospiraceae bacterium]|nr:transporter associated domain-containing protein [Oscillospiraceae bacterium]